MLSGFVDGNTLKNSLSSPLFIRRTHRMEKEHMAMRISAINNVVQMRHSRSSRSSGVKSGYTASIS